jgi:hypothetical protein
MRPNGLMSRRQIALRLSTPRPNEIRTAEVIGSRCLATDLAIGLPIEHLPQSTLLAWPRRSAGPRGLSSRLGRTTTACCPIAGCTTDADIAAALFPDGALLDRALQPGYVRLSAQTMRGILRVLSDPDRFAFSGSIRWHGMHVNGQLVVPAGGQLKTPKTAAKAGTQRVSRWPHN